MLKQFKGSLLILFASLCFGSYGVFAKYLSSYDLFYQTYVRCFIIVAILVIAGLMTKQIRPIKRNDYKYWLPILVATTFTITPITIAFRNLPLGTVSFLFYSAFTIFTYTFGKIFFKEKITPTKIISAALALVGLLIIFTVNIYALLLFPMLMAILNGLASSAEAVFSKNVSSKYSSLQVTMMVFLVIGVTHFVLSLLLGENQDIALFTQSGSVIFLFSTIAIVGVIALYAGYRELDPSIGALVGLTEIIFSVLFGMLFFQEILSPNTIIGGILIIVAAGLPNLMALKAKKHWSLLHEGKD